LDGTFDPVEKLDLPELGKNRIGSGCPINDLLGFWIHIGSPISGHFSLELSFSTATGVCTHNLDSECNVNYQQLTNRFDGFPGGRRSRS
jgi:hypothetical protein